MIKKILAASVIALTASASTTAFGFANTDILKIAQQVYQSITDNAEYLVDKAMEEAEMQMKALASENEVEAMNNGAANYIARINQAAGDIFNLQQKENMVSAPGTCSTAVTSMSLEDALCSEQSIIEKIRNMRIGSLTGLASNSDGQISAANLASDGSATSRKTQAQLKVEEYDKEITKNLRNLEAHANAGRKEEVNNPELALIHDSAPYQFTKEELDIAMSRNFIEYRPFLDRRAEEPLTDKGKAQLKRRELMHEMATAVSAKHLALKAPGENDFPSRLMAMNLAAKIRLLPDGNFDNTNESFLQTVAVNNSGDGATSRESVLMYSIRLNNELEKYKQLLALERQLALIGLAKLDNPNK